MKNILVQQAASSFIIPEGLLFDKTFNTISDALNYLAVLSAAASSDTDTVCHTDSFTVMIAPGIYHEKIELGISNISLVGLGATAADTIITYDDFAYDIMPDQTKRGTFRSYTFLIDANNVTLQNLSITNSSGDENTHGQAIALYADGDKLLIENCRLTGHQDTLFTGPLPPKEIEPGGFIGPKQYAPRINGHHHYKNCYICGNVDFIFGSATALFENCCIESLRHTGSSASSIEGYITAPSTPEGQLCGYIFKNCDFISSECPPKSVYLGRPWRDYAKSVFIDCRFGKHIHPEGFHNWNKKAAEHSSFFAVINCMDAAGKPYTPKALFVKVPGQDTIAHMLEELNFH